MTEKRKDYFYFPAIKPGESQTALDYTVMILFFGKE